MVVPATDKTLVCKISNILFVYRTDVLVAPYAKERKVPAQHPSYKCQIAQVKLTVDSISL